MERKIKNIFIEGPVTASFIAKSIASHQSKTTIGAHQIFLGQVRADIINEKKVAAIDYTAHVDMALNAMHQIRENIFTRYDLTCMHVYHSLGKVTAGELCLFVFVSSAHRDACVKACAELVERIKAELPVWGKEIFEDDTHQWKINK